RRPAAAGAARSAGGGAGAGRHPAAQRQRGPHPRGAAQTVTMAKGAIEAPLPLVENGVRFFADPAGGQKTGWFYDQRDNRALVAKLARGLSLLDVYAYCGGFAVQAAAGGAASVLAIDRSAEALALAARAAEANGVAGI